MDLVQLKRTERLAAAYLLFVNGKQASRWVERKPHPPGNPVGTTIVEAQDDLDLETLSKPELIRLVNQLQSQLKDFAAPASRLMFLLAVAAIPWRLRIDLLRRPAPPIYADYTDLLLFAPDIFLLATLLLWLLSLSLRPRAIEWGPIVVSLPLAGLTLMGLVSVIQSVDPILSAYHAVRLALLYGFYLYIVNEVRSLEILVFSAGTLVFTQALVGIAQVLTQKSVNLQMAGEYLLDPSWNGVSIASANGIRLLRAYGLTDHPNILGGCLAFALLILGLRYATSPSGIWRPLLISLFGMGSLALLFSLSRSAWVAFMGGWLLALGFLYKSRQLHACRNWLSLSLSTLLLLSPFLIYLAPYLGIRLGVAAAFNQTPAEEQSIGERQLLNRSANQLFAEQPLTGIGLGAFPSALRAKFPDYPLNYQPAHMVLLDVAAETGLFGALFYLVLLFSPWLAIFFGRRQLHFTAPFVAATALLLAVSLVGLFDYYPWLLVPGRMWSWLTWGFWGACFNAARQRTGAYV